MDEPTENEKQLAKALAALNIKELVALDKSTTCDHYAGQLLPHLLNYVEYHGGFDAPEISTKHARAAHALDQEIYDVIAAWDVEGGKHSKRDLARRIASLVSKNR